MDREFFSINRVVCFKRKLVVKFWTLKTIKYHIKHRKKYIQINSNTVIASVETSDVGERSCWKKIRHFKYTVLWPSSASTPLPPHSYWHTSTLSSNSTPRPPTFSMRNMEFDTLGNTDWEENVNKSFLHCLKNRLKVINTYNCAVSRVYFYKCHFV